MVKQVTTLQGLGNDLSRDASLKLVLRRALNEAMAAGMALGVVACGSSPLENSEHHKPDAAADVDASAKLDGARIELDTATNTAMDTGPKICRGLEPLPCLGPNWLLPSELHPNGPFSYLAAAFSDNGVVVPAIGTPCKDAQNEGACITNLDKAKAGKLPPWSLLATRGDEVLVLDNAAALAKFLAPIDTATEAAVIAATHNLRISCNSRTGGYDLGVECRADGFRVVFPTFNCPNDPNFMTIESAIVSTSGEEVTVSVVGNPTGAVCPGPAMAGRAPDGLSITVPMRAKHVDLAHFLLDSALFEAASIPSFLMLAEDLRALDAPATLVKDALAAAQDEVVHAHTMASLAQSAGATDGAALVPARARKSLWAVAQENAIEACVRETYGALVAHHQAACATDPAIAEAMATIAEDETRHAALGHRIALWAQEKLSEKERSLLKTMQSQAVAALRFDVQVKYEEDVYVKAGMPTPAVAMRLLDSMERHVWS
jgi:hypothetical protein